MIDYVVDITGDMPLIYHSDNVDWADEMERWKNDPKNKKNSRAGDDRSPAFRWLGCLHHDGENLVLPAEMLMPCLMLGATHVLVPGGRSGKTFKAQSQSGIMPSNYFWPLLVNGKRVPVEPLFALKDEASFEVHKETAKSLGFELFVKRAKIGTNKHVRVRPRFHQWAVRCELTVIDDQITKEILEQILHYAGRYKGLGDWRPSSKTPGVHGTFRAKVSVA